MGTFRFILVFGYIFASVVAQPPPPSVIGQRNPNAIKSKTPEEPVVRNPGVPVASVSSLSEADTVSENVNPTASSPTVATTAAAAEPAPDYTPLGQTGAGVTLEGAWNTLFPRPQADKQPEPAPISQPDPFDIFGAAPSNNLFDMGSTGPPKGASSSGPSQGSGPDMGFGGLPLAALALAGGGLGEGFGSLGGGNMIRMLGGAGMGFGGGLLGGGMGRSARGGGGMFGTGGQGGQGFDLMRTMLIMQLLGGDAPDPPANSRGRPGAPGGRPRSPLEELLRMERIRMLRSQQMERAMRNRNAPQNRGSRFEFQGRPRLGPDNNRPMPGRGRRGIRPAEPSPPPPADMGEPMPPRDFSKPGQGGSRFSQGGLSPADAALKDSLLKMLGQVMGQPNMNDMGASPPPNRRRGPRPMGRGFGRMDPPYTSGEMGPTSAPGEMGLPYSQGETAPGEMGPSSSGMGEMGPPSSPMDRRSMLSETHYQRNMRVGSQPRPSSAGAGVNPADRKADRADMMADYMDNMQAMSPLQRLMGGGMAMPGMGMSGGVGPMAGLLGGGMGNLGLAALIG